MPNIYDRLVSQMKTKGANNPYAAATAALQKTGNLKKGTRKLTEKGKRRSIMGAAGRAKDRAAKGSGRSPGAYKYNPRTNRATLKK
jgi:hypothetical protein